MKLFASFFASAALFLLLPPALHAQPKLRVGVIIPLSGPAKQYGDAVQRGLQMAAEDRPGSGIELLYEDDALSAPKTVTALHKLTAQDRVDAIITIGSTPSGAAAPIAESSQTPLIAWASDPKVALGRSYVIRSYVSGQEEGRRAAAEAARRGYSRTVELLGQNDYALSFREGFDAELIGRQAVLADDFPPDAMDFRSFLVKARAKNPDSAMLCLGPGQNALAAKQAQELGLELSYAGCETLHSRDEIAKAGAALEGAFFATVGVSDDFRERYRRRWGNEDVISGAAIHYDVYSLLADASRKPPRSALDLVRALLNSGRRSGAAGEHEIVTRDGDQMMEIKLVIREITKDGFRDLK